jgi:predicted N-acetyltransferase YhbS
MIRAARPDERNEIYLMGYDVWGGTQSTQKYLEDCANSKKYGAGTWWVLEEEGRLVASLIIYRLSDVNAGAYGLGSIAVPIESRKSGHATKLIRGVLETLDREGATEIYIHSDIPAAFYERLGFRALPESLQAKKNSTCMLRSSSAVYDAVRRAPAYF